MESQNGPISGTHAPPLSQDEMLPVGGGVWRWQRDGERLVFILDVVGDVKLHARATACDSGVRHD